MKVLWIVNILLNKFSLQLYNKPSNGLWMDALLEEFVDANDIEIVVATTLNIKKTIKFKDGNVTYYALPDNYPLLYNENKKGNIKAWQELLEGEKPDLIQVWGTEFTHGLCCLRLAKDIPSVIYMQGLMGAIADCYRAGISVSDIKKSVTIRDLIKRDGILLQQRKFFKQAIKETEMLELSGSIICENDWCESVVKQIVPTIKVYRCQINLNKIFSEYEWDVEKSEKYSIISTASGYTIKGLHILLKALAIVKTKYPEIKLYVPGVPQVADGSLSGTLHKTGYTKYVEKLIKQLDIKENIVWLGILSQEELARQYTKCRVFVMPSAIENHSSSLKEAMMVGMPCISSSVGGIPEYVKHGENGLLYNFGDYNVLADCICKLIEYDEKRLCEMSQNARRDMIDLHGGVKITETIHKIYKEIVNSKS